MTQFDIIVYGATGFTGKIVAHKLKSFCEKNPQIKFAIAGRSTQKLQELASNLYGDTSTSDVATIIADTQNAESLRAMTGVARCVVNCTGPYSTLGEPVIQACLQTGTHYVDMTAELHFMLDMYQKYHKTAEEAKVLIVPACGYGSLPAALGMVFLEKHFQSTSGILNSVDCYTELKIPFRALFPCGDHALVHYGTWASLVGELQNYRSYTARKAEIFPHDVYDEEKRKRCFFHRNKGKVWFPYPGPDHDIIDITERHLQTTRSKKPVKLNIFTTMPWFLHIAIIVPVFFIYFYASKLKCFRKLLLKFPRFFTLGYISHEGPSKRNLDDLKFSFVLNDSGVTENSGNNNIVLENKGSVKVSGVDPYAITAIALMMSAVTVVEERDKMPSGGVLMPGAAFYDTNIIHNLQKHGLKFEMIE